MALLSNQSDNLVVGGQLFQKLAFLSPTIRQEVEAWVVNTVKVKIIIKLDKLLESPGKMNARKLFLVPIFTIKELKERVENQAPEIKTLFYKELFEVVSAAEKKLT